jgi:hypothetical protein
MSKKVMQHLCSNKTPLSSRGELRRHHAFVHEQHDDGVRADADREAALPETPFAAVSHAGHRFLESIDRVLLAIRIYEKGWRAKSQINGGSALNSKMGSHP